MDINPIADNLTVSIIAASSAAVALAAAVWRVANFVRDVRDEMRHMNAKILIMVSRGEMERWTNRLERINRNIGLNVPSFEAETDTQTPV